MKSKVERKLRALVYCRVSTLRQEEEGSSLDSQERECLAYAEAQGYEIVKVIKEQYSGAYLDERPLFNAERKNIKNECYDVLLSYAIDRLSRDTEILSVIHYEVQKGGAVLDFVKDDWDDSTTGHIVRTITGLVIKIERDNIKERCVRGKREKALQGFLNNAADLYGYRTENKRRYIKDDEAEIVKRIYDEYLGGKSCRRIVAELNNEGIPSPAHEKRVYKSTAFPNALNGQPLWGKTTIHRILTLHAYYGKTYSFIYKGVANSKNRKRLSTVIIRDKNEWIEIKGEGVTPAIVTEETWKAVQLRLATNKRVANADLDHASVLFRGIVECGECHAPCYWEREKGQRGIFRCSKRCGAKRINADKSEGLIWERLAEIIRNPSIVTAELKKRKQDGYKQRRSFEKDVESRRESLNGVERQITRISRRMLESDNDLFVATAIDQLKVKQSERERLTLAVKESEKNLLSFDAERASIKDATSYFKRVNRKLDGFGFAQKKMAIEALNVKIIGSGKELLVRYSLPIEKQETCPNNTFHRPAGIGKDNARETSADDPAAA